MKRIALALLFVVFACCTANAQSTTRSQAQAVATCGSQSLTAGVFYPVTQDLTGTLCTGSGGGGSTSVTQGTVPWVVSGQGTAGTAATGVVTVQGIASMTPLLVTPATNSAVNVAQINGVTPLMGNGVTGTGSPRVTIASDNTAFAVNATAQAGTNRIGYISDDPCSQKTKLNAAFSTSSGGPVSIVALSGSTVVYICSISAIADTAVKLSFIDGTGGSCASAQHAIWGSTTAANGMSLAANGGFTQGSGNGSVGVTTAASALCLLQSGTSLIAGNVTYVQQ